MKNALEEKVTNEAKKDPLINQAELKAKLYFESCMDTEGTIEALAGKPVIQLIKEHFGSWPLLEKGKASPHVEQVRLIKLDDLTISVIFQVKVFTK